jgi:hypothetical protein
MQAAAAPVPRRAPRAVTRAVAATTAAATTAAITPARCAGDRRRASEAPPRRPSRLRKGTPQATEQLCLAV